MKGYKQTQEHIDKRMEAHIGKKRSKETRNKMSKVIKLAYEQGKPMGFASHPLSKESRSKGISKLRGRKNPAAALRMRENNPMRMPGIAMFGKDNPSKRPEVGAKISCSKKGKQLGKDNPNWKGGVRHTGNRGIGIGITDQEWFLLKKKYNNTCPNCGETEPDIKLEKDHIVPVIHNGRNYIENIQPLCVHCNRSKHTNIVKYMKKPYSRRSLRAFDNMILKEFKMRQNLQI